MPTGWAWHSALGEAFASWVEHAERHGLLEARTEGYRIITGVESCRHLRVSEVSACFFFEKPASHREESKRPHFFATSLRGGSGILGGPPRPCSIQSGACLGRLCVQMCSDFRGPGKKRWCACQWVGPELHRWCTVYSVAVVRTVGILGKRCSRRLVTMHRSWVAFFSTSPTALMSSG